MMSDEIRIGHCLSWHFVDFNHKKRLNQDLGGF